MAAFSERDLFGGAMVAAIPRDWINASEVPDQQDVWLSPTTATNIIFELDERVSGREAFSALTEQSVPPGGAHDNEQAEDIGAALYHLEDIRHQNDTLQVINAPHPVMLGKFGDLQQQQNQVSAYAGLVHFVSSRRRGMAPAIDGDSMNGSGILESSLSTYSCRFLLVRLKLQETDLLINVNVRHDEFDLRGDPLGLSREEDFATELLAKLIETLEIRDWGLFGPLD